MRLRSLGALAFLTLTAACAAPPSEGGRDEPGASSNASAATAADAGASATSDAGVASNALGGGGPASSTLDGGTSGDAAAPLTCPPQAPGAPSAWLTPPPRKWLCTTQESQSIAACQGAYIYGAPYGQAQGCIVPQTWDCMGCAYTTQVSALRAVLVAGADGGLTHAGYELNVPVCVAVVSDDRTATGCGAKLRAHYDCLEQACESCAVADKTACKDSAETSVCAATASAAACAAPYLAQCTQGTTNQQKAYHLINVLCGP